MTPPAGLKLSGSQDGPVWSLIAYHWIRHGCINLNTIRNAAHQVRLLVPFLVEDAHLNESFDIDVSDVNVELAKQFLNLT